jgi:hypothetical protein
MTHVMHNFSDISIPKALSLIIYQLSLLFFKVCDSFAAVFSFLKDLGQSSLHRVVRDKEWTGLAMISRSNPIV